MKLTIANRKAIQYACMHYHYAKAVPVNTLGYNVYNEAGEWCGVILYGTGANNNIAATFGLPQGGYWNLFALLSMASRNIRARLLRRV